MLQEPKMILGASSSELRWIWVVSGIFWVDKYPKRSVLELKEAYRGQIALGDGQETNGSDKLTK